jgi:hypothetical protein
MTIKAIAYDKVGNASGILEAVYGIAPIISVEVPAVSGESHLDITWHTDDPATSRVVWDVVSHPVLGDAPYYGYANSTVEDSNKVTEHSVVVVVPHSDTTYYYRVISGGSPDAASPEFSIATDRDEGTSVGGNGNGNNNVVANATNVTGAGTLATPQTIGDEQVQGEQSAELEQGMNSNEMVAGEQVAKEPAAKKSSIWKNVWTYIIIAIVSMSGLWWLARRKRNSRPGIIQ